MLAIYPQPLPRFLSPLSRDLLWDISSFFTVTVRVHQHGFILCFLCLIAAASFIDCPPTQRSPLPVSLSSLLIYAGRWLPMRTSFRTLCPALVLYALSHHMALDAERRMHIEHIDLRIAIYHSAILEKSPWKATEIAEFHSSRSPHLERSSLEPESRNRKCPKGRKPK